MALNPGDLLFVGWDSDNDDIAFITTTDIAAGEVIYFTDDEWDGTSFFGTEQLMEWTVPTGGITAGTVVTIDMDAGSGTASIDSGGSLDYIRGDFLLARGNEMFWAFQGTRVGDDVTPTNFVAVIGNEADGNNTQTPNLTGTGLTPSNGALIIDGDEDYMEWIGDIGLADPVLRQDLIDSILDPGNWATADGGGNNNPNGTGFDVDPQTVVCFARGTRITMAGGDTRAVEDLGVGDRLRTLNSGPKPIRWLGSRRIGPEALTANPALRPIRISAGALGQGHPERDLLVSRQHRLLLSSEVAELMFGTTEVLISAIRLTTLPGVHQDNDVEEVEYFHLLLDRHEIIFAEGAPSESLFTGPEALKSVPPEARREILAIFPDLQDRYGACEPAALIPAGKLQRLLVAQHFGRGKSTPARPGIG